MTQQKSKKRMAERRSQRRRQSQMRLIVGISLVAIVAAAVIAFISLRPKDEPREIVAGDYKGIPQEIDRSGAVGIAIGEADAQVTLVEYSDFSCSHCETLSPAIADLIDKYAADGRLRVIYKPVSFVNPQYSEPAARAAVCAAEQGKGWQMIEHIWGLSSPASYTLSSFSTIDTSVELDTDLFEQCYNASDTKQAVSAVIGEAQVKGIDGTPALFVNNVRVEVPTTSSFSEAATQAVEAALGSQG